MLAAPLKACRLTLLLMTSWALFLPSLRAEKNFGISDQPWFSYMQQQLNTSLNSSASYSDYSYNTVSPAEVEISGNIYRSNYGGVNFNYSLGGFSKTIETQLSTSLSQSFNNSKNNYSNYASSYGGNTSALTLSGSYLRDWQVGFGRVIGSLDAAYAENRSYAAYATYSNMSYSATPSGGAEAQVQFGLGRVRNGSYAYSAILIVDELRRKNLLAAEPSFEAMEELSQTIGLRRNLLGFGIDQREFEIETAKQISLVFIKYNLIPEGVEPLFVIMDVYRYSSGATRNFNFEAFAYGGVEFGKRQTYANSNWGWDRTITQSLYPQVGAAYNNYWPIDAYWQLDWSAGLEWSLEQDQTEEEDAIDSTFSKDERLQLSGSASAKLSFYPDTRNSLSVQAFLNLIYERPSSAYEFYQFAYDHFQPYASLSGNWTYELNYNLDLRINASLSYVRHLYQNPGTQEPNFVQVDWEQADDQGNWSGSGSASLTYRFF